MRLSVVRLDRQNLPKALYRTLNLSLIQKRGSQAMQGAHAAWSVDQGPRKRDLGISRIATNDKDPAQLQQQSHRRRLGLQPTLEDGLSFLEPAHRAKQDPELLVGGRKRRLVLDRALQSRQRLAGTPRFRQRSAQMRLDPCAGPLPGGLFKRRDRLARAPLRQQGDAQEMQRVRVLGIARHGVACQTLGVARTVLLDRFYAQPESIFNRGRQAVVPTLKVKGGRPQAVKMPQPSA